MKVIGLTGGIGSGKSTMSRFLAELGALIIDADKIGHELFKSDTEIRRKVIAAFGEQILTPSGDIDREKLGEIAFSNPDSLVRLNRIMHPRLYEAVKAQIEECRQQGTEVVVLEAPLLIEAGWTSLVDKIWVTVASEAAVLRRLQERTGLSEPESLARIRSQLSSTERVRYADVIIDTDCNPDELKTRLGELWRGLQTTGK